MNTTQKSFRFCIEPDAPIATLEAALAIVRRLGIELRGLRSRSTAQGLDVLLRLAAPEEDPLTLCRMRLHGVIGIQAIREMPASAPAPASVSGNAVLNQENNRDDPHHRLDAAPLAG